MPIVTIDPTITGDNVMAGVPATITVTGTAEGCEYVRVEIYCNGRIAGSGYAAVDPVLHTWQAVVKYTGRCPCGSVVEVVALSSQPEGFTTGLQPIVIACGTDTCPDVIVSVSVDRTCTSGKRRAVFTITFQSVPQPPVIADLVFGDGFQQSLPNVVGACTLQPIEHWYTPSTQPYQAYVDIRFPSDCPDSANVPIAINECPPPDCSKLVTITISGPTITGCEGTAAFGSPLQVAVSPGGATSYSWEVTTPDLRAFTRTTTSGTADETSGWREGAGPPGALDLSVPGDYAVSVFVSLPGVPAQCCHKGAAFTVPACAPECPSQVTLVPPRIQGCSPGGNAAFSSPATVSVTWPGGGTTPPGTTYEWTVVTPDNRTFTKTTQVPTADGANWYESGAGPANLDLSQPGDYTIAVTVRAPGLPEDCPATDGDTFTVQKCPDDGERHCPTVTSISVSLGECAPDDASQPATLTAQVSGTVPVDEYVWEYGDGSTWNGGPTGATTPPHSYSAPGTYEAKVTVRAQGCPDRVATRRVHVCCGRDCDDDGDGLGCLCAALLAMALAALAAALVFAYLYVCTGAVTVWLLIAAIASLVLFTGLILLWQWLCSSASFCRTLCWVIYTVLWLMTAAGIATLLGGLISICFWGRLLDSILLGYANALLMVIAGWHECSIPKWPIPSCRR